MKYTFDPKRRLIIVVANIFGPRGETAIKMALDTGASQTQIIPMTLEDCNRSSDSVE